MTIAQAKLLTPVGFTSGLGKKTLRFPKARKTHDYTHRQCGSDYVFDALNQGAEGYMTGQGRGIKQGDFIVIKLEGVCRRYEVQAIDYYASPPNMWIAYLVSIE